MLFADEEKRILALSAWRGQGVGMARPNSKRRLKVRHVFFGLCALGIGTVLLADRSVRVASEGRVFTEPTEVPPRRVAIVLGCAERLANGRPNLYFTFRVHAAAELYHAGVVEYILVSGDNRRHDINDPEDMKRALAALGVPEDRVVCDYAGLRTLDTVVRARKVFQLEDAVVVSQDWHTRRAIYLAQGHGLDLVAFAARDVSTRSGVRTRLREQLAKVKAFLDLRVLRTAPRHLGEPVHIGSL